MTKDEALKLALEALVAYGNKHRATYLLSGAWDAEITLGNATITAIKEALEQPVQEPVARVAEVHMSRYTIEWTNGLLPEGTELFAAPQPPLPVQPERLPLTDEQIKHLWETRVGQPCPSYPLEKSDWVQFTRAIEAAHNIGAK
jgi:hypothetical protein